MIKPPAKGLAVVLLVLAAGIAAEASGTADAALIAAIALAALTAIGLAAGIAIRLRREARAVPVIRVTVSRPVSGMSKRITSGNASLPSSAAYNHKTPVIQGKPGLDSLRARHPHAAIERGSRA